MNRWLQIVEWKIERQMVVVVPSDCLFDQIVRRVIDEMMIDTIAQRAEIFQNAELNTANVAVFEQLEMRRSKGCGGATLKSNYMFYLFGFLQHACGQDVFAFRVQTCLLLQRRDDRADVHVIA